MNHSMLGFVAELMKKGIDPSGSLFGAIGVRMMGEAPEVLTAVIEVQGFGRLGEAVLDQVPNPEGPIGHDENFFGPGQPQLHRLGLDLGTEINDIGIWRDGDDLFFDQQYNVLIIKRTPCTEWNGLLLMTVPIK
jgi:hypothetical protein